jgi:hypothetical protein
VRLLQLETDDNYILDINQTDFLQADIDRETAGSPAASGITAIAYEAGQQVLAAATVDGRVCLSRRWAGAASAEQAALSAAEPQQWEPQQCFQVRARAQQLAQLRTGQGPGPERTFYHICALQPVSATVHTPELAFITCCAGHTSVPPAGWQVAFCPMLGPFRSAACCQL